MPEQRGTFASFAATHEDRLVRSVVSETGLSPAAAARVASDVLPEAYERRFGTPGAAYGWLRVAARHHAAGDPAWADAADTALGCAGSARTALACLPVADRELLRLRYAEGLRPDALAERLGLPLADVLSRLDHAAGALARSVARTPAASPDDADRPRRAFPVVRVAAAAAAVAAAVVVVGQVAPQPAAPLAGAPLPRYAGAVPAGEPGGPTGADADTDLPARRVVAHRTPGSATGTRTVPPPRDAAPPATPPCRTDCGTTGNGLADEVHVTVPKDARQHIGRDELVVRQDVGNEHLHVCDALEPLPREHAYCVRGRG